MKRREINRLFRELRELRELVDFLRADVMALRAERVNQIIAEMERSAAALLELSDERGR